MTLESFVSQFTNIIIANYTDTGTFNQINDTYNETVTNIKPEVNIAELELGLILSEAIHAGVATTGIVQ